MIRAVKSASSASKLVRRTCSHPSGACPGGWNLRFAVWDGKLPHRAMDMDQGSSDPTRFVMGPINAVYAVSARLRAHQLMFANSVPDELLQQASAGG
jgi:hypothetical protein